jgi:hypothetical protein
MCLEGPNPAGVGCWVVGMMLILIIIYMNYVIFLHINCHFINCGMLFWVSLISVITWYRI